jgi:hypothetical protein
VAWFPLGPGEVYVPAYHVSRNYVNQINVTNTVVNVTKINNVYNTYTTHNTAVNHITYVNQASVTAVSRETFVNARPVARNVVVVQPQEVAEAPISHLSGVEPIHGSVMGAGKPTTYAPPRAVVSRQVVALHAPAQPPTPFAQRTDKLLIRPATPAANTITRTLSQPVKAGPQTEKWPEPAMNEPAPAPVERSVPTAPKPEWQAPRPAAQAQRETSQEETSPQSVWSHPQARPAPPVQPKSESQARDEETKHRNWEAKPQPARTQPERAAPPPAPSKK